MTRPRIAAIPGDYDPRYPRSLAPDEYQRLIEPDQRARLLRAASLAGAVSLGAAAAAQEAESSKARTDAVLAILTEASSGSGGWLKQTTFQRIKTKGAGEVIIPSIPISFGNSHSGVFDAERARDLARDLFRAYGLKPRRNHPLRVGKAVARLDVYDPALQIGTKLRGLMPEKGGLGSVPGKEPPSRGLADEELVAFTQKGHRIHCADLAAYPLMDGDQVTPTLAYLAGVVSFLNEVTSGPDIQLDAVLGLRSIRTTLAISAGKKGVEVRRDEQRSILVYAQRATELIIPIAADARFEEEVKAKQPGRNSTWQLLKARSGPGTVLMLRLTAWPGPALRVEQDGEQPIRIDAKGSQVFLPPRFDPRRAFRVILKLAAKQNYRFLGHVELVGNRR